MKLDLSLSDPRTRRLLIIGGVILLVIIGILIMIVRSQSKFAFPTDGSTGDDKVLYDAIQVCTANYRSAVALGNTDSTPPKSTCIKNAVDTYVSNKCPFVSDSATYFGIQANQAGAAYAAYQAYVSKTAGATGSQYGVTTATNYVNPVITGTTSPTVSADIVKKARKADLTGPTRRYLATSCSGIYAPASGSTDSVSSIYTGWTASTSGTPTAGTTTTYGFYNDLVTAPRILEWSIKAADMVTVTPAVNILANASSATLVVSNPMTLTSNTKITVTGIGGICTVSSGVTNSTSIPISFTAQSAAQTVTAGTPIYMNTQTTITGVAPRTSAGTGTAQNISSSASTAVTTGGPFTGCVITFSGSLDSSIGVGSQVLLSGLNIPGNITVDSTSSGTATLSFDGTVNTFPSFPVGQTIENVISIPYANPVQSNPPLHVTTAVAAGGSASNDSASITVNGIAGLSTGTVVKIPSLGLPSGSNVIKVKTASSGAIVLTNYTGASATSITWPAIPVGTVITDSTGSAIAQTVSNATYNKIGKLNGTVMPLWQIAQTTGPGTYWPNFNTVAQPQYSL